MIPIDTYLTYVKLAEINTLTYIDGESEDVYNPDRRVMNELASFCHAVDTLSASKNVAQLWPQLRIDRGSESDKPSLSR